MFDKLSLRDLDVMNKKVLVRVDFNVPLNDKGEVTDDTRIRESLPTIRYIIEHGGAAILMSHLGRPKGKRVPEMSLRPAATALAKMVNAPVALAPDCVGAEVESMCRALAPKGVLLLENLRFHKAEEENDLAFAKQLASLGDVFVNDAFGSSHRAHASVEGITHYIPAAMGMLVEKELKYFGRALTNPDKPFVAIVGGAKVSDKLPVLSNLLDKVNCILIGGGMCYTFLKAKGISIGLSKVENEQVGLALQTMSEAEKAGVTIHLPFDHVLAKAFSADAERNTVKGAIPDGWMGLDIGPETARFFASIARNAGTVVWNGPLGVFEMEPFSYGSKVVAQGVADCHGTTIIGGGDTAAAVALFGLSDKMSHVSTGGGASLELLQGLQLPGIASLSDRK
ncbi:MAG: phosphoglycerate kinase [Candidatus Brocadiia bacterium]